ncbi:hypothetical protein [Kaistia sp. MMO-174]|uniref:GREB1-related protein n=1 Tax=Kaistia sp. MMO-174 TaxID=3081256 RepID=UPI00301707C8
MSLTQPQFPVYIPTKGRHKYMITSKVLTTLGVPHFLVVEPQQSDDYRRAVDQMKLDATVLEMDLTFKDRYELCDDLGLSKSTGPGPARNFAWEHSIAAGHAWHWVIDDNIKWFYRLNRNLKVPVSDGTIFRVMEDFALRYSNVAMAGPNYFMFASRKTAMPPFVTGTRIYSCNLIRNDVPFRWRGRYNEDTILSLDMLKAGWTTIQFNAFLQEKMETQKLPGGNTDEFYLAEGTKREGQKYSDTGTVAKSRMLCDVHPDVAKMAWRFKRWHHHVDYAPFKARKLVRAEGIVVPEGINDYGMVLKIIK